MGAYGVITDANDRYKKRQDEDSTSKYLAALTQGQQIDPSTPDYNPLAHHKATLSYNEAVQSSEQVRQQQMKTVGDRIKVNTEKYTQAFKMANQAKAAGDSRRSQNILMASYNDLSPDGYTLGWSGDKMVVQGPDGKVVDSNVTEEEMWKMAQQMADPQAYAQSYIGEYTKNKAHNQEILANPEVITGPGGKIALRLAGLVDTETGTVQPTYYTVDGVTRDEAWARENGFKDIDTQKAEVGLSKDKAELRESQADASSKEFGVSTQVEDRAKKVELTDSQIYANYNQQKGAELSNANKTTAFIGLDGQEVQISNTAATQLEKEAKAASQNWSMGINELTPQHMYSFYELLNQAPAMKDYIRELPTVKDKKQRAEMTAAISEVLKSYDLDVFASNPSQLHTIINKRGSTNE
jgi:hypothetical protein